MAREQIKTPTSWMSAQNMVELFVCGYWRLISATSFRLLWDTVWVEALDKYPTSHREVVENEREISTAFQICCWLLIFYTTPNCQNVGFLKIDSNMESETISMNFLYTVISKFIGLYNTFNGFLPIHDSVMLHIVWFCMTHVYHHDSVTSFL